MNRVTKWVIGMVIVSIVIGLFLLLFTFAPGNWMMGNGSFMGDRNDGGMTVSYTHLTLPTTPYV